VTFVTPVVVAAARRQRRDVEPYAYLVLAMSNAASLLLPGSNLTNLIVLGETHASGGAFVRALAAPWAASVVATLVVITVLFGRRMTRSDAAGPPEPQTRRVGWSAPAVGAAVVAMVTLSPGAAALIVLGLGLALLALDLALGAVSLASSVGDLNAPLLVGLLGVACALGTLGRVWSGPTHLLADLDSWAGALVGAGAALVVNNLPAASLLAARPPAHAAALLVGLNLGPNLALWGSLAGVLWFQSARAAGWTPSVRRCSYLGMVVVPVTMAASLGALAVAR
jgi:arsenical pump membrane protein